MLGGLGGKSCPLPVWLSAKHNLGVFHWPQKSFKSTKRNNTTYNRLEIQLAKVMVKI